MKKVFLRRPIVLICLSFCAGIYMGTRMPASIVYNALPICIAAILLTLSMGLSSNVGLKNFIWVFLALCFLSAGIFAYSVCMKDLLQNPRLEDQMVSLKGYITSVEVYEDKAFFSVEGRIFYREEGSVSVQEKKVEEGKYVVKTYEKLGKLDQKYYEGLAGRRISSEGKYVILKGRRNPGGFDHGQYMRVRGIRGEILSKVDELKIGKISHEDIFHLNNVKNRIREYCRSNMGRKEFGIFSGILFGEKRYMSQEEYQVFQRNGTAHILAVSGIHMGMVYGFLVLLLGKRRKLVMYIGMGIVLVFYGAMADFSPSVTRALLMVGMHMLSQLLNRRYDMMSAGMVSMLIMTVFNPLYIFDVGMQMSFLAVFTLAIWLEVFKNYVKISRNPFMIVFIIQLGLAPYIAYRFNFFSFSAYFVNPPIIFLVSVLIPFGILLVSFMFINDWIAVVIASISDTIISVLVWLNNMAYWNGFWNFQVNSPSIFFLFLYYGLFFFVPSDTFRLWIGRRKRGMIVVAVAGILLCGIILDDLEGDDFKGAEIVFLDVGQGSSIFIESPDGKTFLIDGGGSAMWDVGNRVVIPFLLKRGVRKLDFAIATHMDEDHYGGIRTVVEMNMADILCINPYVDLEKNQKILKLKPGMVIGKEKNFEITALGPLEEGDSENENSLVLKVRFGSFSLLVTGDIGKNEERELVRKYYNEEMKSDALTVPHHGSRYSSTIDFIETVAPKYGVIQVGKNNYGHPATTVVEKYRGRGIMLYRNDERGAIGIHIDRERSRIVTMKNEDLQ